MDIQRIADKLRNDWSMRLPEFTWEDMQRLDLDRVEEEFYEYNLIIMGLSELEIKKVLDYMAHN